MPATNGKHSPGQDDPPPFTILNADAAAPLVLVCDHASNALPAAYGNLGLDSRASRDHIAWDPGAAEVTRHLSEAVGAAAVLSGASRLFIDCNRSLDNPASIVAVSDGVAVPGNAFVDEAEAERRADAYFRPFHAAVEALAERFEARGIVPALVHVHSFTPTWQGFARPWHVGNLWERDARLAAPLLAALRADPALVVGDNEPYSVRSPESYSLLTHGAGHGRPHVEIEIRQDLVETDEATRAWAQRLAAPLVEVLADKSLFVRQRY